MSQDPIPDLAQLIEAGRLDEAEAMLKARLDGHPNDAVALTNLGLVAMRRADFEAAWIHLQKALSLDARNSPAHSNLAAVLVQLANFEDAERHALSALSIDPANDE